MTETSAENRPLKMADVFRRWWPLAASWVFMAIALPACNIILSRLPDPEVHLAAFGSIVFPIALIIEAPIIMLLATSTALSKNQESYRRLRRFMMISGGILTGIHMVIAFTPLYYTVVEQVIGAPEHIVEPARIGLMILTPWTWSIAYRRFNQGVLIRYGHSGAVGTGAAVRLSVIGAVLFLGYYSGEYSGTAVGTAANSAGVIVEAVFIGLWVRSVRADHLEAAETEGDVLTWENLFYFYTPLALTSMFTLAARPLISAGLTRMPLEEASLAVWPVTLGFLFLVRSMGLAYKEVVVALVERFRALPILRRFTGYLTAGSSILLLVMAMTPLADFWFRDLHPLRPALVVLGKNSLWVSVLIPGLVVLTNYFQGLLVYGEKTNAIIEAVVLFLFSMGGLLFLGARIEHNLTGLYVAIAAYTFGNLIQVLWLWYRSRSVVEDVKKGDRKRSGQSLREGTVPQG